MLNYNLSRHPHIPLVSVLLSDKISRQCPTDASKFST